MERRYGKITRPRSSHSTRRHILNHDHDLGCVSFSNLFSCTLPLKPTSLSSKGFFALLCFKFGREKSHYLLLSSFAVWHQPLAAM